MKPELQLRVQRYGWDRAATYYESCWQEQLKPAHDLLIREANLQKGQYLLDVAAGTGLISFVCAKTVGTDGRVTATDISDKMVEIGNNVCRKNELKNIRFHQMNAESLAYPDNSFDVASCALGLMYFPDPEQALVEIHRVLKPKCKAITAVWGSRKKCGWASVFSIVDSKVKSDVCPMFFNLGEADVLRYYFQKVGYSKVRPQKIKTTLRYNNEQEACDAIFLGGPVAMAYSRFDAETKNEVHREYLRSISQYKINNGYEIPAEFVVCSGHKQ